MLLIIRKIIIPWSSPPLPRTRSTTPEWCSCYIYIKHILLFFLHLESLSLRFNISWNNWQSYCFFSLFVLERFLDEDSEQLFFVSKLQQSFEKEDWFCIESVDFSIRVVIFLLLLRLFINFDKIQNLNLAWFVVFLHQLLSFHSSEIVESSDSQRELSILFLKGDLQFEILELVLFASHISDHTLGRQRNIKNWKTFAIFKEDFHVIET